LQLPIEFLPQIMIGVSSGAELKQRAGPDLRDNSQFAKVIEEALAKKSLLPIDSSKPRETDPVFVRPVVPLKPNAEEDEILAAGAMADLHLIVSILEGDKESAATLAMQIDATETISADAITGMAHLLDADAYEPAVKPEQQAINADSITGVDNTDADEIINALNNAKNADAAYAEVQTGANDEAAAGAGEATARMPAKTTNQPENKEINSKSSDNGNLSPLENENDTAPVKEHGKPQDSNMAQTDRREPRDFDQALNNASAPLAEGIRPERFKADQQMKQASFDAPVKAENLFEEMISRIDSMKTDTMKSMTIQLKPEFLGKVALEIAIDAAGLHVKIDAANSDVRAMINGQITALIESLEQKGVAVVGVEVTHTGIDNGMLNQSNNGHAQSGKSKHRYSGANATDRIEFYSTLPFDPIEYYLDTGVSSVEYRA